MLTISRPQSVHSTRSGKRFALGRALNHSTRTLPATTTFYPEEKMKLFDASEIVLPTLFKDEAPLEDDMASLLDEIGSICSEAHSPSAPSSPPSGPSSPSKSSESGNNSGSESRHDDGLHLFNRLPSATSLAARLGQHRLQTQTPALLTFEQITVEEKKTESRMIRRNDIIDDIVQSDASLVEPIAKVRDPMAPPPALEPREATEKQREAIKNQLAIHRGEQTITAVAVAAEVSLERRRWVWAKVAEPGQGPFSKVEALTLGDPWQVDLFTPSHRRRLIEEAKRAKDGQAKMKIGFPHVQAITPCKTCRGKGAKMCKKCDGVDADECFWCEGKGMQTYSGKLKSKCKRCSGTGKYVCASCNDSPKIACKPCEGKGTVVSELVCAIDIRMAKLPCAYTEMYHNHVEKRKLLETVRNKINHVYHASYQSRRPSSTSTPYDTQGVNTPLSLASSPASSQCGHDTTENPMETAIKGAWYPVSAHCVLETYEATSIIVDRPLVDTKKNRLSLRPQMPRSQTAPFLRHHYIVSSSDLVPIRKVRQGTISLPTTPSARSLDDLHE